MTASRASTVLWALVLLSVAVYSVHAGGKGNVVEIGLSIASVAYGCLLGVFLLGTLTRYATQTGAIIGMITGFALNLALWRQPAAMHIAGITVPKIAYTWYVLIGALVTFAVGSLASLIFRKQSARRIAVPVRICCSLLVIPEGTPFHCTSTNTGWPVLCASCAWALPSEARPSSPTPDFSAASAAINTAIVERNLRAQSVVEAVEGRVRVLHRSGSPQIRQRTRSRRQAIASPSPRSARIFDVSCSPRLAKRRRSCS